jgi:cysteinyl-tRNA synthetase
MSLKYLGETLDIHGGGQDLIFPHHENEIAQSESFTGVKPFVRHWLHNGLLQLGEEKMSKSTGKLVTISEALAKYSPDALRLWVLSSHYRSPITYSDENLTATEKGVERLRNSAFIDVGETADIIDPQPYRERFTEAMDDDFNTPQALAALFDLAREINRGRDEGLGVSEAQKTLLGLAKVLGLKLERVNVTIAAPTASAQAEGLPPDAITTDASEDQRVRQLVEEREKMRKLGQWQRADEIRGELKRMGFTLEDTPKETILRCKEKVWRYKKP